MVQSSLIGSILHFSSQEFNIIYNTSILYHSQENPEERVNRILKTMIVSFIKEDHRTRDEHLSDFRFAYSTDYQSLLKTSPVS